MAKEKPWKESRRHDRIGAKHGIIFRRNPRN